MKKKLLWGSIIFLSILSPLWWWQANKAEDLFKVKIPFAGNNTTSYSLVIGESQIYPYGTIWKRTIGENCIGNFPIYYKRLFSGEESPRLEFIGPSDPPQPVMTHEEIAEELKRIKNNYYPTPWVHNGSNWQRQKSPRYFEGALTDDEPNPTKDEILDRLIELVESKY